MKTEVVFTAGAWDLFHIGHLNFLLRAKALGNTLIVGVMTDEAILKSHGDYPIIPFGERLAVIRELSCVDIAVSHKHPKDYWAIDEFGATIRAAGPKYFASIAHVEAYNDLTTKGIRYIFIPRTPHISTTIIKERCCEQLHKISYQGTGNYRDNRRLAFGRYYPPP